MRWYGLSVKLAGAFVQAIADGLEGRSPSKSLQVLGEVARRHEGKNVGLDVVEAVVMEPLHRRLLDGSVHTLGLAVGPGMVELCQTMLDAVFEADAVKDMPEPRGGRVGSILRQVGKGHAVVGQHRANFIREGGDDMAQES